MKKIILYKSSNCTKCPQALALLNEVVSELNLREGLDYEIKSIDEEDAMLEALQHQIAATPSFLIGDELAYHGKVPKKESIIKEITS